jgi:hypothetical protein
MIVRRLALLVLIAPLGACGSDDQPGDDCPAAPASATFHATVLPIFRGSCGLSETSCHGSQLSSKADLYLGPKPSEPEPDAAARGAIIAGLVNRPSKIAPSINLVTPGAPEQSFLISKLDGTHDSAGLACIPLLGADPEQPCGDSMPQGAGLLCKGRRDTVRRWVAQGANDD